MGIEFHDVHLTYSSRNRSVAALENVTLSVAEQEFVCLVGPSGCGKTTLLKLTAGLLAPDQGEIRFTNNKKKGALRTAMVFQDHGLFPWMTVIDNMAFGLEMQGVEPKQRRAQAHEFIDLFGLSGFGSNYPHELSGGMQQRVAIARAFLANPQILLMDEPFGALDSQTRIVLQEELLRVWKDHQKTVLYVTHDIEEAVLLGDRVIVMTGRPGRIRDDIRVPLGRPRQLAGQDQPEVNEIKWQIWKMLEDEVRQGLQANA